MVKYIVKSRFWRKHYIFYKFMRSFCTWHFLENMFERCSFWRKCLIKKGRTIWKIKNVNFDMKIKNRITTRYCFCSINTFWYPSNHFFGFLKLYIFCIILVYFWYISRAEFLPPTVYIFIYVYETRFVVVLQSYCAPWRDRKPGSEPWQNCLQPQGQNPSEKY